MTELIDLATLASLGQHFSTLQDSSEMRADMIRLQRELNVMKSFLSTLYGSQFSDLFSNQYQGRGGEHITTSVKAAAASVPPPKLPQQQRKPPPLQRAIPANNGQSQYNSKLVRGMGSNGTGGRLPVAEEKVEKFHRNFLSISSLKSSSSSPQNGGGGGTTIRKIGNGSLSISKLGAVKKPANNVSVVKVKVEPAQNVNGGRGSRVLYKTEYVTEGADFNGGDDEDESYPGVDETETGGMAEYEYYAPKYEENGNANGEGDYEEIEDDLMGQVEYQEDDAIYDEGYDGVNGLEAFDMTNGSNYLQGLPPSSLITTSGSQPAASKKAIERRVTYPTPSTTQANDGSNNGRDSPFHKKCKVCQEEVPSFSLFNHVVNTHYQGEVPTCRICNKTFTYRQGLISHMRYHDAGKYDKACSYCGKRFIRRSDVIIHERRLHTGERPYQCPVPQCNQGFVRRYCLLTHVKTNHGEPYMSQLMEQSKSRRKSS